MKRIQVQSTAGPTVANSRHCHFPNAVNAAPINTPQKSSALECWLSWTLLTQAGQVGLAFSLGNGVLDWLMLHFVVVSRRTALYVHTRSCTAQTSPSSIYCECCTSSPIAWYQESQWPELLTALAQHTPTCIWSGVDTDKVEALCQKLHHGSISRVACN